MKQAYHISYDMFEAFRRLCRRIRLLETLTLAILLASCQSPQPTGPEGSWSILPTSAARLTLALQDLTDEPRHALFRSKDGRYVEETAQWGGADPDRPGAGLRLSEASPGPPLTDPRNPEGIIAGWTALLDKRPAFSELGTAENDYGPASWWRVALGTSVCVVFVQPLPPEGKTAATLSGYYCNPQGLPLSPQAAATVVKSIRLHRTAKTQ